MIKEFYKGEKGKMATAVIDLRQIEKNAAAVKNALPRGCKFYAVVKADGYGHGGAEVANAVYTYADGFAVATAKEAIALRYAGIEKEVYLLFPPEEREIKSIVRENVSVAVGSAGLCRALSREAVRQKKTAFLHVAVNTGMNREGVDMKDLPALLKTIKNLPALSVIGVTTHYAAVNNEKARLFQRGMFQKAAFMVKSEYPSATAHISASGGILKGDFFDGVRAGILLYGYYPFPVISPSIDVKPAMKVFAPVFCERDVLAGQGLLYGEKGAPLSGRYALYRYGYADGLFRAAIEGNVARCMDVSAAKRGKKERNAQYFSVLDKNADEIAEKYGTISYEVLTLVARRALKRYLR